MRLPRLATVLVLIALASATGTSSAVAQPFSFVLRRTDLPTATYGRAYPVDFGADGNVDLVISGATGPTAASPFVVIARGAPGDGEGLDATFTQATLDGPVWHGSGAWADANGDGRPDLLLTGTPDMEHGTLGTPARARTTLYLGTADGSLRVSNSGLPDRYAGAVVWIDANRDGDPDVAISGLDDSGRPIAAVYPNRGDGTFETSAITLPALALGALAVADVDRDGYDDLVISGMNGLGEFRTVLLRNEGGSFVAAQELEPLAWSSLDFGDYDADGDPDLVLTGASLSRSTQLSGVTRLYRNDGGTFVAVQHAIPGVFAGGVRWGDLDQDGDLDLVVMGLRTLTGDPVAVVLENRNGVFSTLALLPGAWAGSLELMDVDGDRDLDLVMAGQDASTVGFVRVIANVSRIANHEPGVPTNLQSSVQGRNVTFSWTAPNDASTPAALLAYDVRVSTAPGAGDVVTGSADPVSGRRVLPGRPNAGSATTFVLDNLPQGTYHWTVQSVDAGFTGGAFAPEAAFAVAGGKAGSTNVDGQDLPSRFDVASPWPNPFAAEVVIQVDLPEAGLLTADVFDIAGRRVARLRNAASPAGRHLLHWDGITESGSPARAGLYAVVVRSGAWQATRFAVHLHE